ncbi:TRAP transporter substrate-binding protein DctP [Burkholderia cenocepacia]|uniref:TRAP transporter substrate-binding protein DctP n=1 Tax=Burkholderia cenocepacia TaxID=95486 RepID=UPI002AB67435|nr:TRAP transporter substrate-binding protein DctP [Burkholderia cenocepacia]
MQWEFSRRRRLVLNSSMMLAFSSALPVRAGAAEQWDISTSYPENTVSGAGVKLFAQLVSLNSPRLAAVARYSVPGSVGVDATVSDVLNSSFASVDPVFELPTLPFVAHSAKEAKALLEAARSYYDSALTRSGRVLLYTSPWPPSGIWSSTPVRSLADLRQTTIRTYDQTSASLFDAVGATSVVMPMSDAIEKAKRGGVTAILSSGDGSVGETLAPLLPYFTKLGYAIPISFATIRRNAFESLDRATRNVVLEAGAATEEMQWRRIHSRIAENAARMRVNGVAVHELDAVAISALHQAAAPVIDRWKTRVGDVSLQILKTTEHV